jgi:dTDP-L-rhamnose 4-epimerase
VRNVLVTGGAGFIGARLVQALLERGHRVRVLDNFDALAHVPGRPALDPGAELLEGDLRDPDAVARALDGVENVFHLGGIVGNGESLVNVRRSCESNTVGTAILLEALIERRDRVRRLVVASSMVVYGEGAYECAEHGRPKWVHRAVEQLRRRDWEPRCPVCGLELTPVALTEDHPLQPRSVYGITKRDQEELALVLGEAYGIESVALRFMNVYGAGQALHNPYTGVVAIFAARLLAGRAPLAFEDGRQLRQPVHVSDAVRAAIAAAETPQAAGHPINVGGGELVTVAGLADSLAVALGSAIKARVVGQFRFGDIRHCFADSGRARALLDFEPLTPLSEGLPELADWVARQTVEEKGDEALAALRASGLVA